MIDLRPARSVAEILATALRLLGRRPLLLFGLAALVIAPYDLLVLAIAHSAPLGQDRASAGTVLLLALLEFALVEPLVAALQVNALITLADHDRQALRATVARSLRPLPVVVATAIISGIGIGIGLLLFVVPGVYLLLRWSVAAQVAASEPTDWPGALRRSSELAVGNLGRILGLRVVLALVSATVLNVAAAAAGTGHHPWQVAVGIAVDCLIGAFQALVLALLLFDLRARQRDAGRPGAVTAGER